MADRSPTILHLSDLQCGKPFVRRAADAVIALAGELKPDVLVASGDLTQRAKTAEYRFAMDLLRQVADVPTITTPGNHDIPVFRVWERALAPYRNYRRFVNRALDTVTSVPGATFVAINSGEPYLAVVNGRLSGRQMTFVRNAFAAAPEGDLKVLVTHHHFVPVPGGHGGAPIPGAVKWLGEIEDAGADFVLGGHVHRIHINDSHDLLTDRAGPGIPVVAVGTATSSRGRPPEEGWNSLSVVRSGPDRIEITPYRLSPEAASFVADEPVVFPRRGATAKTEDS